MMKSGGRVALALMAALALAGCDNAPPVPKNLPATDDRPATAPATSRPTTQELLTGPTKKLNLNAIPFSVTVPQSWEVKTTPEGLTFLEGPSPAGDVQIQLAKRHNQLSKEDVEALIRAAKRDADAHPEAHRTATVREMASFRILDRQSTGTPVSVQTTDPEGKPTVTQITPYQWTILLLLPRGTNFEAYELSFYDLTLEQFTKDKQFLQKIVDSVIDEPATGA
jgi:hypothetical protein